MENSAAHVITTRSHGALKIANCAIPDSPGYKVEYAVVIVLMALENGDLNLDLVLKKIEYACDKNTTGMESSITASRDNSV